MSCCCCSPSYLVFLVQSILFWHCLVRIVMASDYDEVFQRGCAFSSAKCQCTLEVWHCRCSRMLLRYLVTCNLWSLGLWWFLYTRDACFAFFRDACWTSQHNWTWLTLTLNLTSDSDILIQPGFDRCVRWHSCSILFVLQYHSNPGGVLLLLFYRGILDAWLELDSVAGLVGGRFQCLVDLMEAQSLPWVLLWAFLWPSLLCLVCG